MDTEQDIDLMLTERSKVIDNDISDESYKKLGGIHDFDAGDRIRIMWQGEVLEGIEDDGYLFQLPVCEDDSSILDFFVHIPHPDNSSGIGDAPQVFTHFIALLENKLVKSIQKI